MKKINKLLVGTCCLAAATSMALGVLAFAEEQPQEQENAIVQEVQENVAPAEPLPTREEYVTMLADFNKMHKTKLAIDWDGIYADIENGKEEDYNNNQFLDKAIPEMTAEEFQACLEKIYAWSTEVHSLAADEINPENGEKVDEALALLSNEETAKASTALWEAPESMDAYLTEQRYYYKSAQTSSDYMANYLYANLYWVSADGENHYTQLDSYGGVIGSYPGYRPYDCDCVFLNYSQDALCMFKNHLYYSDHIYDTTNTITVQVMFTANGGDVID